MFGLIRVLSPIVAVLCSVNVFLHLYRLKYFDRAKARSKAIPLIISLVPALLNLYFMLDTFTTSWMALLHLSLTLLVCDIISLIIKAFGRKRKAYTLWRGLVKRGLAFALGAALAAFGLIQINIVRRTDYAVSTDKPVSDLQIALIADVHLGVSMDASEFEGVLTRALASGADMFILAGDLTDESTELRDFEMMCASLKNVRAPLGAYFVFGNHDGGRYGGGITDKIMETMLTESGVTVLTDESVLLNGAIRIVGRKDANDKNRKSPEALLAGAGENEFVIMVDHQPTDTRKNADAGADLLLSGHTHNGQIWPLGIISELFKLNEIEYGYEKIGSMDAIVTSGASGWGCAFRTSGVSEFCIISINGEN